MPTVLRLGRVRVMIFTNDHRPAHVHAWEGRGQAVFLLNCPGGPGTLRENFGFSGPQINRLVRTMQQNLQALCEAWSKLHGDY